ncbi:TetR/AcrR family transcriptional regulator [Actinomadura sp. 3N407]|uniref:TetR/AcrR family transcriptional regulator n=1 Tax=Actinomadura sp. 3N407 TaxID=3457423 RepID=UPI003FCECC9E
MAIDDTIHQSRRRPKDRKQQIVAAAARQFRELGYGNVSMADIADDVGITAGALYRHFRSKQDLLLGAMWTTFEQFEGALGGTDVDLDDLLDTLATFSVEERAIGVLWQREARNLTEDDRQRLRRALRGISAGLAAAITRARPDVTPADADLLGWAVLSVLASPGYHAVDLKPDRFVAMLDQATRAVCAAGLTSTKSAAPADGPVADGDRSPLHPVSRRETLLSVAIRLFSHNGFQSVGISEIGAAASITGASVYHYFPNKLDILLVALNRAQETLWLGLHYALESAGSPSRALQSALRSYIEFGVRHPQLLNLMVTELLSVPEEERHALQRKQHAYMLEWASLLREQRKDLTAREADLLVQIAFALVNDLTRINHLHGRPTLPDDLAALCLGVLNVPA